MLLLLEHRDGNFALVLESKDFRPEFLRLTETRELRQVMIGPSCGVYKMDV